LVAFAKTHKATPSEKMNAGHRTTKHTFIIIITREQQQLLPEGFPTTHKVYSTLFHHGRLFESICHRR
jgi:hypothetical protein